MGDFETKLNQYREKQTRLFGTEEKINELRNQTERSAGPVMQENLQKPLHVSAYRQILACDFESAAWIKKDKAHRKHRKNIDKNYKSLTGHKFGLPSHELKKRKAEFDARRALSLEASMAMQTVLETVEKNAQEGSDEDFLAGLEQRNLTAFSYPEGAGNQDSGECDKKFIDRFKEQMPILHRASVLYRKLLSENRLGDNGPSSSVLDKLAWMNEARQAYEDRIRIISSPYYVSFRAGDFDEETKKNLKSKEKDRGEKSGFRSYAGALLRWKERGLSLLTEKEEDKRRNKGRTMLCLDAMQQEVGRACESDRVIDHVFERVNKNRADTYKRTLNADEYSNPAMGIVKEWIYQDAEGNVSEKDLLAEIERMKQGLQAEMSKPAEERKGKKNPEKLSAHLDRVKAAFEAGRVSKDVVRLWLDRALQNRLNLSRSIYYSVIFPGKNETLDEKGYFKNIQESVDQYVQALDDGEIHSQSKLGFQGKFKNEKDIKGDKSKKKFTTVKDISEQEGDFIHIKGKNADPDKTSTRVYITAKPQYKSLALNTLLATIRELGLQDELYLKFTTGVMSAYGYGSDDLVIYLGSNVTKEQKKNLLDLYFEKCRTVGANADPPTQDNILSGEDMMLTAHAYRDGIALAGEPETANGLNDLFTDGKGLFPTKYTDGKRIAKINLNRSQNDKVKKAFSYNTFVTDMMIKSTFLAAHRLGKKKNAPIDPDTPEMKAETKKIFRELCFLNGVNPVNMSSIDSGSVFG